MVSTMVLLRTHRDSPYVRDQYEFLRTSGMPVVPVFDRTGGRTGFTDVETLYVDPTVFRELGLRAEDDAGWRCGDYCFYAARKRYPDIEHFWLVEPDVLISYADAGAFFSRFAAAAEVDLIAAEVEPATPDWFWYRSIEATLGPGPVHRCLFGVIRLSARAIDALLARRVALSGTPQVDDVSWPNDESFVATFLAREGFDMEDLNARGTTYREDFYQTRWPIRREMIGATPLNLLLHPVLDQAEMRSLPPRTEPPMAVARRVRRRLRRWRRDAQLRAVIRRASSAGGPE